MEIAQRHPGRAVGAEDGDAEDFRVRLAQCPREHRRLVAVAGEQVEFHRPGQLARHGYASRGEARFQVIEMPFEEVDVIQEVDCFTGEVIHELQEVMIFPASHNVTTKEKIDRAV